MGMQQMQDQLKAGAQNGFVNYKTVKCKFFDQGKFFQSIWNQTRLLQKYT